MVTNNKVLTVSYGTFSCTLEGFDESFDTMKAIAEYFRDLAADDRYFGAEPPTPDAEMLTRIAEREIERRVQARHEAGAIVLSAAPEAEAAEPEAVEPEMDTAEVEQDAAQIEDFAEDAEPETSEATSVNVAALVEASEEDAIEPIVEDEKVAEAAEEFFADFDVAEDALDLDDAFTAELAEELADDEEDTVNLFDDAITETEADDADAEDSIAAKLRRIRAVVSKVDVEDDDEDDYIEDQHADDSTPIDLGDDLSAQDDFEEDIAPVAEPVKPRARVIRMKRAAFEEAAEDGTLEQALETEVSSKRVTAEERVSEPESSLSDEDEADLMAELAEVDAELSIDEPEAIYEPEEIIEDIVEDEIETELEPHPIAKDRRARRASLETSEPGDEAVDRLIDEANTKLDEPEGNRRRSAIAHLRAAVAATKAEKEAGKSFEKEDNSDAYREDLAEVVRPRKAAKSAPPLKLVAEQRIDAQEEAAPKGIRPRRVSVDQVAASEANEASSNFVEFAENMGATQLPDIMEAAASYLTFVEGRKKFSRPMLMRLAYQMGEDRFQREAGLRSFGQLLRDKKIEKIAGGRFTVSDAINFKPDDRAAG